MILGIDPGLASTGWALVANGKLLASGTVKTNPKDYKDISISARCEDIVYQVEKGVEDRRPLCRTKTVIEMPFSGRFKGGSETYFLAGYMAAAFNTAMMVHPLTWSKGYKGKAGERMEAARKAALKHYRVRKRTSEHERDAIAIAYYAEREGL